MLSTWSCSGRIRFELLKFAMWGLSGGQITARSVGVSGDLTLRAFAKSSGTGTIYTAPAPSNPLSDAVLALFQLSLEAHSLYVAFVLCDQYAAPLPLTIIGMPNYDRIRTRALISR